MKNRFVDSPEDPLVPFENIKYLPKAPSQRRPPPPKVAVTCSGCGRQEEMDAELVPQKMADDDDEPEYRCSRCVRPRR